MSPKSRPAVASLMAVALLLRTYRTPRTGARTRPDPRAASAAAAR